MASSVVRSVVIGSRDNAGFKALRALVADPREPRRQGRTVVDGVHLVETCLQRGVAIQHLLLSESGQDKPEIQSLLQHSAAIDRLILKDGLFRELSGVTHPLGIAAVIGIPPFPEDNPSGNLSGDAVLLDAVQDAGNVGAILRSAAAAGVGTAYLGTGCAGAWTPRVLRAGQGAHFSLQIREHADLAAVVQAHPARSSIATVVRDGVSIYRLDLRRPVLWLFGNEGAGVSDALLAAITHRATIPLAATTESLNVAAAAAVCFFEAVRQRRGEDGLSPR
ncbi:MAG TPA: RNA methyltransferase [Rhodocyclaceae bacterium]|nr:RNA methyltransferase [Rhodocyclaceae bacterium]